MQKTRVYKIAQELNMTSKELIEKLEELDIKVTNHMSSLSMEEAEVIIELLGDKREEKEEHRRLKCCFAFLPASMLMRHKISPDPEFMT